MSPDRLGSNVMGLENGSKPPTTEKGQISDLISATMPQWTAMIEAMDELERNPKLTFPASLETYHSMRTDPQMQGLMTGATWPLLRMRWFLDPNGARDEVVEKLSKDLNLPIEKELPPEPADPNALNVPIPGVTPPQLQP